MDMEDPFDLVRFVAAQEPVYPRVLAELETGRKRTHWMWFVFPQIDGLGHSPMARRYAIAGLDEARAYLAHPVLGPRLRRCTELALASPTARVDEVFGYPDDLKFHACMTLFRAAEGEPSLFGRALGRFFAGHAHAETEARLGG
jgi:uncharacterized protein (DUF1810 family)